MILSFFDPLRNLLSFFDPLRDPLKSNAVVPQKYVDALERQGWVKVVRCKDCKNWETDWIPSGTHGNCHWCGQKGIFPNGDFFCADGECADATTCKTGGEYDGKS